jgi:hypothetical protein
VQASKTVRLSWSASAGATYYELGVKDIATGALVVDARTDETSYQANLEPGKAYRWNVAAGNTAGLSTYTTVLYFQTLTVDVPILSVSPTSPPTQQASAGSLNLNIKNTGFGTMNYSARVTSASPWLSIESGGSGGNSGTVSVSYEANPGGQRTGTIEVTAAGASGSPVKVTLSQAGKENPTVILPRAMAYIRQINNSDLHPKFNSANACGPCSAVMVLTYFNRLSAHPMVGKAGVNNDYSWYVAPIDPSGNPSSTVYSSAGFTFDVGTRDVVGGAVNYGAFGYLAQDFQSDPQTRADRAVQYFWKHGMWARFDGSPTESKVRAEIDAGRPVYLSVQFSSGGHIMVIRGYNSTHLTATDPWVRSDLINRDSHNYTWDELHFGGSQKWMVKTLSPVTEGARARSVATFNVRPQPSLAADSPVRMRSIGELGTVLLDPERSSPFWNADGYTWVKIRWDSDQSVGWSAIGSGDSLWIEPLDAPVTTFVVAPSAGANGSISPSAPQTFNSGANVPFTAQPAAGYVVDQWKVDGIAAQPGGASYTLSNVTANRGVQVTFKQRIGPASIVRLGTVTGAPGGSVTVPVELVSQGTENALGFSVAFDVAKLTFIKAELDTDGAGAQLVPNAAQVASGRVGLVVGRAAGQVFTAGVRQILKVEFAIKAGLSDTSVPLTFGDSPIAREVSDAAANGLVADFQPGAVNVVTVVGFEADVAPRPNGNGDGAVRTTDWVQVGRFAAGLDTAAAGSEFQRADCAPRATAGDGKLTTTDWVQAGRYAAGLDTVSPAGGPVIRAAAVVATRHGTRPAALVTRVIRLEQVTAPVDQVVSLPLQLDAQGDENALGFSASFDPARLAYEGFIGGTAFGAGAPIVNTAQQGEGRVGVLQALPFGQQLSAGSVNLGTLRLRVLPAAAGQTVTVAFGDAPVARELSDAAANPLEVGWEAGAVTVPRTQGEPKRLNEVTLNTEAMELSLNGEAGERFAIEFSTNLRDWTTVGTHLIPATGSLRISLPLTADPQGYYRAVAAAAGPVTIQPGPATGKDIWTTSVYSYSDAGGGPGGGRNNYQLRVGGWGDIYYSLLEFDLRAAPKQAESAVLYLYCYHQSGGGTPMDLHRITEPWDWRTQGTGVDRDRLWWADRPEVELWSPVELPVPAAEQWYAIDITDLYRAWQDGLWPNHGLQLQPLQFFGNNFNEFYSADYADDPSLRPRLVITPE